MRYRLQLLALTTAILLEGLPCACPLAAAGTMQAEHPALAFFSSVTEHEFARLQAASITPASSRHGPFRVPAPGFEIDTPALHLLDLRCAPEDWAKVTDAFARWQKLPSARPTHLALPDGRLLAFAGAPQTRANSITGLVRVVTAEGRPAPLQALCISHDGASSLILDLSALPARPELLPDSEPSSKD